MARNILVQEQPLYIEINSDDLEQDFPAIIKTSPKNSLPKGKCPLSRLMIKSVVLSGTGQTNFREKHRQ